MSGDVKRRREQEERAQEVVDTSELSLLDLQAPFSQTIKPHTYTQNIGDSETLAPKSVVSTGGHEPTSAESIGADSPEDTGDVALRSAISNALMELPLLPVEVSSGGAKVSSNNKSATLAGEKKPDLSIIAQLGEGGMGEVVLAAQHSLQREVAIKRVKSEDRSTMATEALLHEGRIMGALSHPNVLPVYALGHDGKQRPVLVMKRVEGSSWQDLFNDSEHSLWRDSQLPPEERIIRHLEIFMDVCNAVAFAHQQGILHRDIKPENVMIGAFGEVLLLDWGLAIRLAERRERAHARCVGTPSYMAPEMVDGREMALSVHTDIYLLGATLHYILMGEPRHVGKNIYKVIFSVMESAPHAYPTHIPEDLAALCNKATHKDPAQRFESAIAFKGAIAAYLRHRGSLQLTDVGEQRLALMRRLILAPEAEQAAPEKSEPTHIPADEDFHAVPAAQGLGDLFSECQFAYMQALQQWPDNPRAKAGLEQCIEWMCLHALRTKQLESAAVYMKRLAAPSDMVVSRYEALVEEKEQERAEQQRLHQIGEELDFDRYPRPRFLLLVGLVILVVLVVIFAIVEGRALDEMNYEEAFFMDILLLSMYVLVLGWKRKALLARLVDRRFLLFLGIAFLSGFCHHLSAYYLGLSLRYANISEAVAFSLLCAFAGIAIQPLFYFGAGVSAITAALMILLPAHHALIYTIDGLFLLFFLAGVFYVQTRRTHSSPTEATSTAAD